MPKFTVEKVLHAEAPAEGRTVVAAIFYPPDDESILKEVLHVGPRRVVRVSEDSGRSWRVVEDDDVLADALAPSGTTVRSSLGTYFDARTGRMVHMILEGEHDPDLRPWEDNLRLTTRRMCCQVSTDHGRSWSPPRRLIQHGEAFDETRWLPGVEVGMNSGYADPDEGMTLDDGTMLFPFGKMRSFGRGTIRAPNGAWWNECGCLFGRWADGEIRWELGQLITLERDRSCTGLGEPSIARLKDGRLLLLARAGKPGVGDFPCTKFHAVSADGGRTWSDPQPLTYEDGSIVYSTRSMVRVRRWDAAGGTFLITNILARDIERDLTPGRHPLQIAQIDEGTLCVKKDTVTVIEDRAPNQPDSVRFSNFATLEDRETHFLRLYMTACAGNEGYQEGDNIPRDAFEYIIRPQG